MAKDGLQFLFIAGMTLAAATVPRGAHAQAANAPAPAPVPVVTTADVVEMRAEIDRVRDEFETLQRQYVDRLVALEVRLQQLGAVPVTAQAEQVAAPPPPAPAPPQLPDPAAQAPTTSQVGPAAAKVFNPDMSVIGNFVGVAGENPMSDQRSLELSEAEMAFQAIVDPYAKADFFLSAGPDGLDVEEGFITFTSLPSNFLLKVGKMRAQFGKVNTLHTHMMPTAD